MINVTNYITKHDMYNIGGQNAIWHLTNGHSLSGIYTHGVNMQKSKDFITFVAKITKSIVPDFYTVNKPAIVTNNGPVYNPCIDKIYVDVVWKDALYSRNLNLTVLKEDGSIYKEINNNIIGYPNGESHVKLEFDPKIDPPGNYIVRLRSDANEIIENKIVTVSSGCVR